MLPSIERPRTGLLSLAEEQRFDDSEWGILFGELNRELTLRDSTGEAKRELVALVDDMIFDRKRVKQRDVLSREQLFSQTDVRGFQFPLPTSAREAVMQAAHESQVPGVAAQ